MKRDMDLHCSRQDCTWICRGTSVLVNVRLFHLIIALGKQKYFDESIKIYKIININITAAMITRSTVTRFIRGPPCCAVSCFISRCVRVTGEDGSRRRASVAHSHGPAKPAFCQYRQGKLVY